jgi:hypothetical protein
MKKIALSAITNEAIKTAAESKKAKALLVGVDPLNENRKLYYLSTGEEVADDSGTAVWSEAPEFAKLKAAIMTKPMAVRDLARNLRAQENKKAAIKLFVNGQECRLTKVELQEGNLVLS